MSGSGSGVARAVLAGARRLGFSYECYRVLRVALAPRGPPESIDLPEGFRLGEVTAEDLARSEEPLMRDCDWYGGPGALGFAIRDAEGGIACLQWYWFGERFRRASFWNLSESEAASVHLVTAPGHRNRGLATALKRGSARVMAEKGFAALYSRIWWTNAASLRVSEKSGWRRVGTTLRITLPFRRDPLSLRWKTRSIRQAADLTGAA